MNHKNFSHRHRILLCFLSVILAAHFAVSAGNENSGTFLLQVDFSKPGTPVQKDFQGFFAEHEVANTFVQQNFLVDGKTIKINAEWPNGTQNTAMQLIDRGAFAGSAASDLLRDWIGTDGRVNKVPLILTLKGIPAGLYEWTSYHHDYNDQTGIFSAKIKDADGIKTYKGIDISNGKTNLEQVTAFKTMLKSDGSDISLSFEMESYPDVSNSIFVMNGFILKAFDTNILPGAFKLLGPSNGLKFVGLNPELKWEKSDFAEKYKVYLGTTTPPGFLAEVATPNFTAPALSAQTTYFWKVSAVNFNGETESETFGFTTGTANEQPLPENASVVFSHERGFYEESFLLSISGSIADANLIYTTDCSLPSAENGKVYSGAITVDSTTIVKAALIKAGKTSKIETASFLFPESILKQGKNPSGFPELWGGSSTIAADYGMDPFIVQHPDYSAEIKDAVYSIPTLSLTMNVNDWFDPATGLYVGYPNSDISREKAVSAEFIFPQEKTAFLVECGVQNQGGTSIVNWKVPKQSMRLLFKEIYGPGKLNYKLFPDSEINSINTLVVDGFLYSWIHPWDDKQRTTSLYFRDQLASDFQNKMGGLSFHGRYVHLCINGLYWGMYDLHERPDDAFLAEYLDAGREDFDIIKHNPNTVVSGSNAGFLALLDLVRKGVPGSKELNEIQKWLDLPAFIDYMILNFYLGNFDWAHQNYYAAVNKTEQSGYRFYTWDAEHVMRYSDVNYNNINKNDKGSPTEIHTMLKANEEYRMMFADAVYKHFYNEGALTPESFREGFLARKTEIGKAIILESARWGDFLKDKTEITYNRNEHWIPEVNKVMEEYIPKRRDIVIGQLRAGQPKLFPDVMPPEIVPENGNASVQLVHKNTSNGFVFYTLDGSDPRLPGGNIHGTKYTGKLDLKNSVVVKARYLSSNGEWSALAEKTVLTGDLYGNNIQISEIMYRPENEVPEFIEITNYGQQAVNLKNFSFTKGIEFTFQTDIQLSPGNSLVLTGDQELFKSKFGFYAFGGFLKKLNNGGETLIFKNGFGQVVDSVSYSDSIPWPMLPGGSGYSIEIVSSGADNSLPQSWKISESSSGSPVLPDNSEELSVKLYPSPFDDNFRLLIENPGLANEKVLVEMFNSLGSKVFQKEFSVSSLSVVINPGILESGIYIVKISSFENKIFQPRILKTVRLKK